MHTKIVQTFIQPHLVAVGCCSISLPAPLFSLIVRSGLLYPTLLHHWGAGDPDMFLPWCPMGVWFHHGWAGNQSVSRFLWGHGALLMVLAAERPYKGRNERLCVKSGTWKAFGQLVGHCFWIKCMCGSIT